MTDPVGSLLIDLVHQGIRLRATGDKLRASPKAALTPELLARMASLKAELLEAVVEGFGRVPPRWSVEGWRKHLLLTSEACRPNHPERSDYFQRWVQAIKP